MSWQAFSGGRSPGSAAQKRSCRAENARQSADNGSVYDVFPRRNTRGGHTLNLSPLLRQELVSDGKNDDTDGDYLVNLWIFSRVAYRQAFCFALCIPFRMAETACFVRLCRRCGESCIPHPALFIFSCFPGNETSPVFMLKNSTV